MNQFCVNISSPEFIKLQKDTGINPVSLAADVSMYMSKYSTDRFPTAEQLKKFTSSNMSVKQGVAELFESNFLIFAESKTSDEVISKLLSNKIIDKKCS